MRMTSLSKLILLSITLLVTEFLLTPSLSAQTLSPRPVERLKRIVHPLAAAPKRRLAAALDDRFSFRLAGHVHPLVQKKLDAGPVEDSLPLSRMILSLRRDEEQQAALDAFSEAVIDPQSPLYHQWLTPEEFGAHFGVSQDDLDRVAKWLEAHGFRIEEVPAGRWMIVFSGTAGQVQSTFRTAMRYYKVGEELHFANAEEPQLPAALAGMVLGISGLHDFRSRTPRKSITAGITPQGAFDNSHHYLDPSDFAAIYNLNPIYSRGIEGKGVEIAVIAPCTMDISLAETYWTMQGLESQGVWYWYYGTPSHCPDQDAIAEVYLDYEWAGAIAPEAKIWLVSASGPDPLLNAVTGVVNDRRAAVITMSYGMCNSQSAYDIWVKLWQQAHASGISGLVSSGDTGAAGCEFEGHDQKAAKKGLNVNGYCHSEYVTCVGGTQFQADQADPSRYWSKSGKALGYIPEVAWNESGESIWGASGGGYSSFRPKPGWQIGNATSRRGVPDIALTSAWGHDAYRVCLDRAPCTSKNIDTIGGTSAASPAMAGIVALLIQKFGKQGSINPTLYSLASRKDLGLIFHDITQGNNSVSGQRGYSAGQEWDPVTGLGSIDATALFNNWPVEGGQSSGLQIKNQRITTAVPPSTGCTIPPALTSFRTTDHIGYLYFEATVASSDLLSVGWLAPDGTLYDGGEWPSVSGNYCFSASLIIDDAQEGSWQARVFNNKKPVISVPFSIGPSGGGPPASQSGAITNTKTVDGRQFCIDVPNADYSQGVTLITWACHGGDNQQFTRTEADELKIGGFCVDGYGGGHLGANIGLWPCHGGPNQKWTLLPDGHYRGDGGFCMAPKNSTPAYGADLLMVKCENSNAGQLWSGPTK